MPLRSIALLLDGNDWWDTWDYPSTISDQCFGNHLTNSDVLAPSYVRGLLFRPRTQSNIAVSGKSEVLNGEKEFKLSLNVSQFKPEELQVKVADNYVVIKGKHEEKSDDHGFITREFTRRYMLPKACEMENVCSSITPNGILTVTAPKKVLKELPKQERDIPITEECKAVKDSS